MSPYPERDFRDVVAVERGLSCECPSCRRIFVGADRMLGLVSGAGERRREAALGQRNQQTSETLELRDQVEKTHAKITSF